MQKLWRLLLVGGLAGAMAISALTSAFAAPITCPGGQSPEKTSSGWACENNGGNQTGAGYHKGTGDHL